MKRFLLLLLTTFTTLFVAVADEGMWLPSLIGRQIKDMRSKGFKLSAEDIYSVNKASLKDGIVLFNGGCTGEFVSSEGLLLTNHHCGIGEVQKHSTLENDYLTNGFWAMDKTQELPCKGLWVRRLVRMEDVTARIASGETAAEIRDEVEKPLLASVESLYYGNQYFLFVYEEFTDVRLVGAPPSSIGKFGGDTDNWMWPRHTGDFTIFRVYADKDNNPSDYSADNKPYAPKKHFKISTKGINEGDFTFVYGFPGTTREYVTSDFIDYTLNYSNPMKIRLRTIRLDIIKAAMEKDRAVRIQYTSKAASIANAWKKWQGESLGLKRLGTLERKREYEARIGGDILPKLHALYDELLPYAMAMDYFNEAFVAIELVRPVVGVINGRGVSESFYKDYSPEIDRAIAKKLLAEYLKGAPAEFMSKVLSDEVAKYGSVEVYVDYIYDNTAFLTLEGAQKAATDSELLSKDPMAILTHSFLVDVYNKEVNDKIVSLNQQITALYKDYMRQQMEFEPERNFYPDANLTLRVAYGAIEGYKGADGVRYDFMTTLDGIIEKDNPEIYDYDIPQALRDIYASKDYGRWAINVGTKKAPRMSVPVAFIATNHTTGGNSGSPVLNARGELVGINFDRTWLSTMSDLEFDPEICRNIAVDIRYILFVIDKIGRAQYLLKEMGV